MNHSRRHYLVFLVFACLTSSFLTLFSGLSSTSMAGVVSGQDNAVRTIDGASAAQIAGDGPTALVMSPHPLLVELVEIVDFQVTQGIQTPDKNVPLIRDHYLPYEYKPAVVRVAARSISAVSLSVKIQATYVFSMPAPWTSPEFKSDAVSAVLSNGMPSLEDGNSPIVPLDLTSHWNGRYADAVTVWIDVYSSDVPYQLLAQSKRETYRIESTRTPQIFFYPIEFPGTTQPEMSTISTSIAAGFVKGIFPAADSVDFYRTMAYDAFTCQIVDVPPRIPDRYIGTQNHDPEGGPFQASEACVIFHHLNSIRNALGTCGLGPDPLTFVYGWVAGNPITNSHGYGLQNGRIAFGNSLPERGQRTFAHELMHNLGLEHLVDDRIEFAGWDTTSILSSTNSYWQGNGVTTLGKAADLYDIRVGGKTTNEAWISPNTYERLQESLVMTGTMAVEANICLTKPITDFVSSMENKRQTNATSICVFTLENGDYGAYLFPLTRWPWSLQTVPNYAESENLYTVMFETTSGEVFSSTYDARIGADSNDPDKEIVSDFGFIAANVPHSALFDAISAITVTAPGERPVRIYDPVTRRLEDSLLNRSGSTKFTVEITNPQPEDDDNVPIRLTQPTFKVQWQVDNLQGRDIRNFEYQILYSHDGGRIWTPLAYNLPGTDQGVIVQEITIDRSALCTTADALPQGGPSGIVRVLASDGFNTESDDVRVSLVGMDMDYCQRGTIRANDLRAVVERDSSIDQEVAEPTEVPTQSATAVPTAIPTILPTRDPPVVSF